MTDPRFLTMFDAPVPPAGLPVALTSGTDAALQLADGLFRGDGLVGRVTHPDALAGVRVAVPAGVRSVRVVVTLAVDDASPRWWDERVPEEVPRRRPTAPRLIHVLSQGESRAVTMLRRSAADRGRPTCTVVTFDLAGTELDPDGLLVVELRSVSDRLPPWAAAQVLPYSAVGVRVDRIDVVARPSAAVSATGHLAGGSLPVVRGRRGAEIDLRPGFFVANPGPAATPVWTLRPVLRSPERPMRYRRHTWRRTAHRKAARVAKELLPDTAIPTVRRGIDLYRTARTELRNRPVRELMPAAVAHTGTVTAIRPAAVPATRGAGPLAGLLGSLVTAGWLQAEAFEIGTAAAVEVDVSVDRGRVRIRPVRPMTGPVLVRVRSASGPPARYPVGWRLSPVLEGSPERSGESAR